jgi:hypothetical protein
MSADIGVIGLAVMGQNLARNMESKGHTVAVYNRSPEKTRELVEGPGKGGKFIPSESLPQFVDSLSRPRKIMIMVKAGKPVDDMIDQLVQELTAEGRLASTYLVLASDNGFILGPHRFTHGKEAPYEESIRVPLLVRGPAIPAGCGNSLAPV